MTDFDTIPLVDLRAWHEGPDAQQALAESVREICHEIGFFIVTHHGVEAGLVDSMFAMSRRLFELPLAQKQIIDKRRSRHFRGWEAEGAEHTNNRPDIREQVDLWTEHPPRSADITPVYLRLLGPNQWLPEDVLPGYRTLLGTWFERVGELAAVLMRILATALGLPPSHFDELFGGEQMSLTKLIRYPPTPTGEFGVNAHHDAGFLTVLAPGEVAGLEVENASGEWIPVPTVPGGLVINLGEILQAMTGNYFVATPHRVVTGAPRYSIGYFHGPALDTSLDPLPLAAEYRAAVAASPRHAAAGFMAQRDETDAGVGDMQSRHHPGTYGEQLWNYFMRSYPDNVERHYPGTA